MMRIKSLLANGPLRPIFDHYLKKKVAHTLLESLQELIDEKAKGDIQLLLHAKLMERGIDARGIKIYRRKEGKNEASKDKG